MSRNVKRFDNGADGPCACSQLRRTARKLTMVYDRALLSAGITVTQYALLVNVARVGEISRTALAARVGMDRTTLTRNLAPLEKAGFVIAAQSEDRRERQIRLSAQGKEKVRHGFTLWRSVQRHFASQMGPANLTQFRAILEMAELIAENG